MTLLLALLLDHLEMLAVSVLLVLARCWQRVLCGFSGRWWGGDHCRRRRFHNGL